eukprot:TRINITY_DN111835_c0_g1_i1.p1 TRINITY_DN111835_c0_g1~~TRINITY_DN111835_c0_g1_i1.p1  ORF type:complete len:344 (+),score=51.50 TRINITY_DN111835_c0_g1_i1:93-1124(+)
MATVMFSSAVSSSAPVASVKRGDLLAALRAKPPPGLGGGEEDEDAFTGGASASTASVPSEVDCFDFGSSCGSSEPELRDVRIHCVGPRPPVPSITPQAAAAVLVEHASPARSFRPPPPGYRPPRQPAPSASTSSRARPPTPPMTPAEATLHPSLLMLTPDAVPPQAIQAVPASLAPASLVVGGAAPSSLAPGAGRSEDSRSHDPFASGVVSGLFTLLEAEGEDKAEAKDLLAVPDCRWEFAQMAKDAALGVQKDADGFVPQKIDLKALFGQTEDATAAPQRATEQNSWSAGAGSGEATSEWGYFSRGNPWSQAFASSGYYQQPSGSGSFFGHMGNSWGGSDSA